VFYSSGAASILERLRSVDVFFLGVFLARVVVPLSILESTLLTRLRDDMISSMLTVFNFGARSWLARGIYEGRLSAISNVVNFGAGY